MDAWSEYRLKCEKLVDQLARGREAGVPVQLRKSTSNLFRHRDRRSGLKMDVRRFDRVLGVDARAGAADVEGMTPYDALTRETLRYGCLPTVTPELKSITVGGAVSGIGIESSSFRFGLVHETVQEMDVLTGNGTILTCSRQENADLFFGFPNSYGTLGYALRVKVRLMPAKPYVHLRRVRFEHPEAFFLAIAERCNARGLDFLDGTVFSRNEMYVTEGRFCDEAPYVNDYSWMRIYYRSIQQRNEDWLTTSGYVWRWDTDWFWCSKQFYAQNSIVRALATKRLLNSRTYQRIMRLAHHLIPDPGGVESVIQDVDIEVERAPEFLDFLLREIGITPIWICPVRSYDPRVTYPLYRLDPRKIYINFGFWDVIPSTYEPGYFNRKVERKLVELNGKKGLYSSVFFDEDKFWELYNRPYYERLKEKYDPDHAFKDLYQKCVGGGRGRASRPSRSMARTG